MGFSTRGLAERLEKTPSMVVWIMMRASRSGRCLPVKRAKNDRLVVRAPDIPLEPELNQDEDPWLPAALNDVDDGPAAEEVDAEEEPCNGGAIEISLSP